MDRRIRGVVELGGDSGALAPRPFPPLSLSPFLVPLPLIDLPAAGGFFIGAGVGGEETG